MLCNFWSQTGFNVLFSRRRLPLKRLGRVSLNLYLFTERLLIFSSCSLSASLSYISTQSLESFQYNKVFSYWPLTVWGFGILCCSGSGLTAVFARGNCITYLLPQMCFPANYIELIYNNLQFEDHLLNLPGDHCVAVGDVK